MTVVDRSRIRRFALSQGIPSGGFEFTAPSSLFADGLRNEVLTNPVFFVLAKTAAPAQPIPPVRWYVRDAVQDCSGSHAIWGAGVQLENRKHSMQHAVAPCT